jgi:hypothetical protein
LVGTFGWERASYHCRPCGHGTVPWDEVLGLDRTAATPGLSEVIWIAGAVDRFAEASEVVWRKRAGVRVSASTVPRTSEAVGQDIGRRLAAGETFGPGRDGAGHKDAAGQTCASVSLDLTGLGMQGPAAAAAEGRRTAVGMVYSPVPERRQQGADPQGRPPRFQARYVAGLDGQASWAEPLRKQAAPVGLDRADRWIARCDAGSGREDLLGVNFPRVEAVILDFYHAAQDLGDLGRALDPGDEVTREGWYERWCHRLKHEGGRVVLEELRGLELEGREAARQVHGEVVRYFENQVHRRDDPSSIAQGWAIGSGPVESACKTVIGKRMKGGGMRWGEDGADEMSHLRALFASGDKQWDAYWHPNQN